MMVDLVEKWQADSEQAFEAFFLQHKNLVFKTAYAITGDHKEAEDVLQEVFVKIWNSRNSFDAERGKPTTWLYRITVNQCISNHRKKKTKSTSLEAEKDKSFNDPGILEDTIIQNSEHKNLIENIRMMNEIHKTVVVLRYFNELSYNEISEVLGIPLGTVKSRLNDAINILRNRISSVE